MQSDLIPKEQFTKTIEIDGLIIPIGEIKAVLSSNKHILLNIKHTKVVLPHSETEKIMLLQPNTQLPDALQLYPKTKQLLSLTYENFSYTEVLKQILPEHLQVPTGFETVGHIAHFNLSEELYPYRHTIGQVLIDVIPTQKTPNIRTVITKIGKIENVFRTFKMEVIAGEENYVATVVRSIQKEGCCRFSFDFSSVYWNSKLSAERDRVLSQLHKTDVICDVFAGVGPFSIRAAKLGCKVLANDLNPASFQYLCENIKKNKVDRLVKGFNLDARVFLQDLLVGSAAGCEDFVPFTDIYMNLPMDAIEFLDVLQGRFDRNVWKVLPRVHVYGFANEESELERRVKEVWGEFDSSCLKFHLIRDVSPKKFMFCVEFVLPEVIAFPAEGEPRKIRKVEEG